MFEQGPAALFGHVCDVLMLMDWAWYNFHTSGGEETNLREGLIYGLCLSLLDQESWFCVLLSVHFTRVDDLSFMHLINTKTASHFRQDSQVDKSRKIQTDRKRLEEERLMKRWAPLAYRPGNGLHVLNLVVNTLLECLPLHQGDSISWGMSIIDTRSPICGGEGLQSAKQKCHQNFKTITNLINYVAQTAWRITEVLK